MKRTQQSDHLSGFFQAHPELHQEITIDPPAYPAVPIQSIEDAPALQNPELEFVITMGRGPVENTLNTFGAVQKEIPTKEKALNQEPPRDQHEF